MRKLQKDKVKHAVGSFALAITLFMATGKVWVAIAGALIIGVGKEVWDYYGDGVASWGDMAANMIGVGFSIAVLLWLIERRKEGKKVPQFHYVKAKDGEL